MPTKSLRNFTNDNLPSPTLTTSLQIMTLVLPDVKALSDDARLLEHGSNPSSVPHFSSPKSPFPSLFVSFLSISALCLSYLMFLILLPKYYSRSFSLFYLTYVCVSNRLLYSCTSRSLSYFPRPSCSLPLRLSFRVLSSPFFSFLFPLLSLSIHSISAIPTSSLSTLLSRHSIPSSGPLPSDLPILPSVTLPHASS
jgi:hypothetical protein